MPPQLGFQLVEFPAEVLPPCPVELLPNVCKFLEGEECGIFLAVPKQVS